VVGADRKAKATASADAMAAAAGGEELHESVSESVSKEVFSSYVCRSIDRGREHPGDISEAASLR
jgi:hypothetical protein